jgi:hypothetical protein
LLLKLARMWRRQQVTGYNFQLPSLPLLANRSTCDFRRERFEHTVTFANSPIRPKLAARNF